MSVFEVSCMIFNFFFFPLTDGDSLVIVWPDKAKFLSYSCFEVTVIWKEILCGLDKWPKARKRGSASNMFSIAVFGYKYVFNNYFYLSLDRDASFLSFFCCSCICYLLPSPRLSPVKMGVCCV